MAVIYKQGMFLGNLNGSNAAFQHVKYNEFLGGRPVSQLTISVK